MSNLYSNAALNISSSFIVEFKHSNNIIVSECSAIMTKCIFCSTSAAEYLIDIPNMVEME